ELAYHELLRRLAASGAFGVPRVDSGAPTFTIEGHAFALGLRAGDATVFLAAGAGFYERWLAPVVHFVSAVLTAAAGSAPAVRYDEDEDEAPVSRAGEAAEAVAREWLARADHALARIADDLILLGHAEALAA